MVTGIAQSDLLIALFNTLAGFGKQKLVCRGRTLQCLYISMSDNSNLLLLGYQCILVVYLQLGDNVIVMAFLFFFEIFS